MNQSLLIFESSPLYLLLCAVFSFVLSAFLYLRGTGTWSTSVNRVLFISRWILGFFLTALLLSPILKYLQNQTEEPVVVIAVDNSLSVSETIDSVDLSNSFNSLAQLLQNLQNNGYETSMLDLDGEPESVDLVEFSSRSSNISGLLSSVEDKYEGRNLHSVILVSDGIYNSGVSPSYSNYSFNLHTIGLGDTIPKQDISIQNVRYNKISYQGNKFPVEVSVLNEGYVNQSTSINISKDGITLDSREITFDENRLLTKIEFLIDATEEGTQQFRITVNPLSDEYTSTNNYQTIFVDVVEGKEKILLISERPHPDIKAIKEAIEANPNYSFETFIRGISDSELQENSYDLVICHQCTGAESFISTLDIDLSEIPIWSLYGKQMPLSFLENLLYVSIEILPGEFDVVTPVVNTAYSGFELSDELQDLMNELPPLVVPFGDVSMDFESESLLFQRVGSIETAKPLLVLSNAEPRKAVLLGEGIWRWRLHDYLRNDSNELFTEFISKLIQFLSSKDDKQKLKVIPLKNEFTDQRVVFDTEVYNELYEKIYDQAIRLRVTNEEGDVSEYTYALGESDRRYALSGLESGIYRYTATTTIGADTHTYNGQFVINELQVEYLNLTADFQLLRNLSRENDGEFFNRDEISRINDYLTADNAKGIIHSSEAYDPFINIPWILVTLLLLASIEWFTRKYYGVY